jgi:hypothetical protein
MRAGGRPRRRRRVRSCHEARAGRRAWVRSLAARLAPEMPAGLRIWGENLFPRHSIGYDGLPSYFLVFTSETAISAWTGGGRI